MALVLVVDDSEDIQEALQMFLTGEGFEVADALNGRRGLKLVRDLHPDVVLLDMMMPEMDGLEFLSRLGSEPWRPPVVASSGFDAYRDEALRRGAVAFLRKPLSMETLVRVLRSAIEKHAVAAAVLAQDAASAEQERRRVLEESHRAVAQLDERGMLRACDGLRRVARWLPAYFGFGTCLVHILCDEDVRIAAVCNGPEQLYEGLQYPREMAYCDDVMTAGSTLVLTDPEHHPSEHFSHHREIAAGYRFYVGTPLKVSGGAVLGTLCLEDTTAHEFHTEDMQVLQSLGRGAARGLELGRWPLDEHGIFESEYRRPFVEAVVERAARAGCASVVLTIAPPCGPLPQVKGLAVVRLDESRVALLWSGEPGTWSPPEALGERALGRIDLSDVRDGNAARARVQAILS